MNRDIKKEKIVAIVGTTASGKTTLAVDLAYKFNGEVVSADSRQVYKYMDIGSGKDLCEYTIKDKDGGDINIPYHLIDVAHPNDNYDLATWINDAKIAIKDISAREKIPVIAGGTGLYAQALLDGFDLTAVAEDKELREKLEKKDASELYKELKKINEDFALSLNNSDKHNKRRLVRYIEINSREKVKKVRKLKESPYDVLIIALTHPREVLRERIKTRVMKRLNEEDMLDEVKDLHFKHGVSFERLYSFGLEYRFLGEHLQGKMDLDETIEKLYIAICQFAKRQMTWLRRWEKQGANIHWVKNFEEAEKLTANFLD